MVRNETSRSGVDGEMIMRKEIKEKVAELKGKLGALEKHFDLPSKQKRLLELEGLSQVDGFWNDSKHAQEVMKELDGLKALLGQLDGQRQKLQDAEAVADLLAESSGDEELLNETLASLGQVAAAVDALEFSRMLSGPDDRAGAILFINAGAGGTESCDWAEMLLRMYRRWCDRKGFKNEVVDFTPGDGAGFRSVTLVIEGDYAYGYLKAENGVHRLVRISPFDANKRRHTSFTSVFVLPDIEKEIEIEVKEEDLKVDTFRSGGAGGQHVNKTESAVRLTHIPSGIVVACQSQRSQHQNRATALKLLKAKLYEKELEKREKEREAIEKTKKKIEWGSQIRSYVMQPYQLVKDHRTDFESGNVQAVMDGEIDGFIRQWLLENS